MPRTVKVRGNNTTHMKTLSQYKNDTLRLEQPSIWKRVYHLRAGDEIVCTMTHPQPFGTKAVIEGFDGKWEMNRPSFWRSDLEITRQQQHLPFAKFVRGKWGKGGMFEMPNGERLAYVQNMWKSVNEIHSQQKITLVSLKRASWRKSSLNVVIEHESELMDRYPWIVMAVYHLILESGRHAA
jgi:hypothetical protein